MKSVFPPKLSLYLSEAYLKNFCFLAFILLGVVYLFDTVELLRRSSEFDDVPILLILQMGLFKLPEVGQMVLPFAVLFGAIFTFWQLTRRYELIAVRAAGLSVWQILSPILLSAFLIGLLQVTLINPFGALLIGKFEALENTHLSRQTNLISLSKQGLWLKQDHGEGHVIVHADTIDSEQWALEKIIVLFFDETYNFVRRLDAGRAELEPGQWSFQDVVSNRPQALPEKSEFITMATDLTREDIEDSFASPETISFWALPSFIETMQNTGFDPVRLKLHYQVLLSQPVLYLAMILLAACVSLRPPRNGGAFLLIASGIFVGFMIFFASSFLQALGASHQIPLVLAAWSPSVVAMLIGTTIIMSLEDG
ncbi:MAG: LPS export ABC transporter permease LptG [Pseudomonadota bacterium]